MKIVREVAIVDCTPQQVWQFLTQMNRDAYLAWHPRDHLDFHRIGPPTAPAGVGQAVMFTERLGTRVFRLSCVITRSQEGRFVEFMARRPLALLRLGKGWFDLAPVDGGTQVEAIVQLGWRFPFVGALLDWVIKQVVDLTALQAHMADEAVNLPDAVKCVVPEQEIS